MGGNQGVSLLRKVSRDESSFPGMSNPASGDIIESVMDRLIHCPLMSRTAVSGDGILTSKFSSQTVESEEDLVPLLTGVIIDDSSNVCDGPRPFGRFPSPWKVFRTFVMRSRRARRTAFLVSCDVHCGGGFLSDVKALLADASYACDGNDELRCSRETSGGS